MRSIFKQYRQLARFNQRNFVAIADKSKVKDLPKPGGDSLSSLMNVIPSVYYDLIARICPGMAFWVALSFISPVFRKLADLGTFSAASLFVLVVLSYLSGIVFTGFSIVWDAFSLKLFSLSKGMMEALGLKAKTKLREQWVIIADKMEAVAKESEDSGRTVTKALAEVALCQNLVTGLITLAVIGFYSGGKHFYSPLEHVVPYVLTLFAVLASMLFRQAMFLGRVQAFYRMYFSAAD